MTNRHRHGATTRLARTVERTVAGLAISVGLAGAGEVQPPISIPAELLTTLALPGADDHLLRPSGLFVDETFGEVLVADAGNNRIVIFDADGHYRFAFAGRERFSMPLDVVADREGYVLVLGSTVDGPRVLRYDFDGTFLETLDLGSEGDGIATPRAIDLASDGALCVLDGAAPRIAFYARDGARLERFTLRDAAGQPLPAKEITGHPRARNGLVFVPLPALGSVYVYGRDGTFLRAIGYHGTNVGELNFPVDVALTASDLLLVLDKHRFTVVCFDLDGRFVGEFGGRGARPGWYYHPTLLAVDRTDRVLIGQVFQNRVDVCRLPQIVRSRHEDRQDVIAREIDRPTEPDRGSEAG